jgi:hypothetical protein
MPLTPKGKKILSSMEERYGRKKGKSVFYASINKGTITGAEKSKQAVGKLLSYKRKSKSK